MGKKKEKAKDLNENSSEGETKQETPESSEQVYSNDQDTTEKSSESDKECTSIEIAVKTEDIETIGSIDEIDESPVESKDNKESSGQVSECEIKDEIKKIEKEEKAKNQTEKSSEGETKEGTPKFSEQVSSKDQETTEKLSEGEINDETMDI